MLYPAQDMSRSRRSSHASSSRRKRSSHYFRLLDLPAELRMLVIELSLPAVNDVSRHWPAPIPSLLATSKQISADTREAMKKWSPMHYVPDPSYLTSIPHPGAVKVETICLSMFHNARMGVLRSGMYTQTPGDDHRDLVVNWTTMIQQLPLFETIHTVAIDATPAPGWLRYDKPAWIPRTVNDRSISDRFIYEHIDVIADLITTILDFYRSLDRTIDIELTGTYGSRSGSFIDYINRRCARVDLDIQFTGEIIYLHSPRRPTMTITRGISELYSTRSIPVDRYHKQKPQIVNAKRRLMRYTYTPTSEFLFQNCFEDDEFWTMSHLERLTDFVLDDERRHRYIDVSIPDFARGSFICSLAKDLNLGTSPRSSWQKKEIRITRKSTRRKAKSGGGSGGDGGFAFADFLITGAAMMAFVALWHYQDRVERRRR